jgi:formylglycine-generating enzyme required for sulfatase activity
VVKLGCVFFYLLFLGQTSLAQNRCAYIFSADPNINLVIERLAHLRLTIDVAQVRGVNSPSLWSLQHDYELKEQRLARYLETTQMMSKAELLSKIGIAIKRLQGLRETSDLQTDVARDREAMQIHEKVVTGEQLIFQDVLPGEFLMGDKKIHTEITKPFALSATLTTQAVWREIVQSAKARFPGQFDDLNPAPSFHRGELRPVEQVSIYDVRQWVDALNSLSVADDPVVQKIIPHHLRGDIYSLPTEAEWEFTVTQRGLIKSNFYFGDATGELGKYAWFNGNSDGKTHDVAGLEPLLVGESRFYDLLGNVQEYVSDLYATDLQGGKDPQGAVGAIHSMLPVTRGGDAHDYPQFLHSRYRYSNPPYFRWRWVGFRLARRRSI